MLPIFGEHDGKVFCWWNPNRIRQAQQLPDVPRLTDSQREAINVLTAILDRIDVMYSMRLEPGDMQILNNHTVLHSRTEFQDEAVYRGMTEKKTPNINLRIDGGAVRFRRRLAQLIEAEQKEGEKLVDDKHRTSLAQQLR